MSSGDGGEEEACGRVFKTVGIASEDSEDEEDLVWEYMTERSMDRALGFGLRLMNISAALAQLRL